MAEKATEFEVELLVMAMRYAMPRKTIMSATLPERIIENYINTDKLSVVDLEALLRELERYVKENGYFGDKNIDHPRWMSLIFQIEKKLKSRGHKND